MEKTDHVESVHLGRKIERVRRLRGMTQLELGDLLGVTKQAISKMEQSEKINDERLEEIAAALGVTVEGLKKYNEETILYNTNNFYENCGVKATTVGNTSAVGSNHIINNFPIDNIIEFFEKLLEKERVKFESLKKEKE